MYATLKRLLIGSPIPTADEGHQRLSKKIALPVFASDAISSTAYATDEILLVLLSQAGITIAMGTDSGVAVHILKRRGMPLHRPVLIPFLTNAERNHQPRPLVPASTPIAPSGTALKQPIRVS